MNKFKKEYEELIKANPDYDYFEEHLPEPEPHLCPVCGEFTFPDLLSEEFCPICGWEDNGFEMSPDEPENEFQLSFNEYVLWFKSKRLDDPNFRVNKKK